MMTSEKTPHPETGLFKTLKADFRQGGLKQSLRQDWAELKQFYLDESRKDRLAQMGRVRRFIYLSLWLVKSMLLRLTPARRVIVVIGCSFLFFSPSFGYESDTMVFKNESGGLGGALILIVLMLELKDKLLAKTELSAGRKVQSSLMPDTQPTVQGWDIWMVSHPANDVGGDLLDFQTLGDTQFGIALGDVAGKGLPAALLMAKLQSTLRALAPDTKELPLLGKRVNRIFYRDGLRSRFASLLYVKLDGGGSSLRILNAGHMPPLVVRDCQIDALPKGEAAFGLTEQVEYREQSVDLHAGDWLLLYSDGLNEAQNTTGDFFGDERLSALLLAQKDASARETGEKILAAVSEFVGSAPIHDDLTLVILKKT